MLLTAVHKAGYLPSVNCVYAHLKGEFPTIQLFFGVDLLEIITHNLEAVLLRSAHPDNQVS